MTSLVYFREVLFLYRAKPLKSLGRGSNLEGMYTHPGMTVILAGFSLTVSVHDLSVTLCFLLSHQLLSSIHCLLVTVFFFVVGSNVEAELALQSDPVKF